MCLTVPGQIVSVEGSDVRIARVDFGVAVRLANLMYAPEANVGDFVIVQAGFAVRVLSAAEAEEALAYHRELAETAREGAAAAGE
jgi:hydrogenase expression/formation protein HypC